MPNEPVNWRSFVINRWSPFFLDELCTCVIHLTQVTNNPIITIYMIAAQILLTMALQLLIAVQSPNVTPELRDYATTVAQNAITYAQAELNKPVAPEAPQSQPATSTPPAATPAPVIATSTTLRIMEATQEDTGRWNAEKGHGCFRTTIYVSAFDQDGIAQSSVAVSMGTTTTQITNSSKVGIASPVARFVFQPFETDPQIVSFTGNGASVEYACQ